MKKWIQKMTEYKRVVLLLFVFIYSALQVNAQHRGDNLAFQGVDNFQEFGVKAAAMGGAVSSLNGNISSIAYNTAGLATIDKLNFYISGFSNNMSWTENQNYRPNRFFVNLPFYLEGYYTPLPEENGMFDYERVWTADGNIDSSYILTLPDMGLDPFSEEAADWKKEVTNSGLNNVAAAIPFELSGHKFVVAAAYNRVINIDDYDVNETYLDPHIGYLQYGDVPRVDGVDTLIMNWDVYHRERAGKIDNLSFAVAYDISKELKVGLGFKSSFGDSKDYWSLNRVGYFDLVRQQRFRFSYDTLNTASRGESKFSSTSFNLGFQADLDEFKIGIRVDLPYTLKREWDYTYLYEDADSSASRSMSGTDEVKYPAIFTFGASFQPVENFILAIDYEYAPLSSAEFSLAREDSTFRQWTDKHTFRVGAEFKPWDFLSLLAGYRNIPAAFIPDGAAIKDAGPKANSYTFGVSVETVFGIVDLSYELRTMRYYDSYYSNTNYNTIDFSSLLFGYTFKL
jgi:long-subunit fatty acid transport protein